MTVRIQPEVGKALDGIAASLERDRTYVVSQALEAYIDTHQWQIDHIRQGLREANAGTSRNSEMGRRGRVAGSRELVVAPYVIAYRSRKSVIEILGIIHGARRWPDAF